MLIAIFIISFPYLTNIHYSVAYFLITEFIFALYDVLIKKYMDVLFKPPYFIMLYLGIIITVFSLISDIIAYFVNPAFSRIINCFINNLNNIEDFLFFILDLILQYAWNLGIWLLIFYFSPCHYFISDYASEFFYFIMEPFKKYDHSFHTPVNYALIILLSLIIFFFCLIFNEVLILNFCKLDYNTSIRIKEREKIEKQNIAVVGNLSKDSSLNIDEAE